MMPLKHKPHWRVYLDALVCARQHTPFAWGSNDCALFASDAVQATTGFDPASKLRGYSTAREALRLIRERGGLWGIATMALGDALDRRCARTGDVALVTSSATSKREALAVCVSVDSAVVPGLGGLQVVPMEYARCIWRVG